MERATLNLSLISISILRIFVFLRRFAREREKIKMEVGS